jgi:hypothetical protein
MRLNHSNASFVRIITFQIIQMDGALRWQKNLSGTQACLLLISNIYGFLPLKNL